MAFDLLIRNARLRSRKSPAEIRIEGGRIRRIARRAGGGARRVIDAGGLWGHRAPRAVVSHGKLVDPDKLPRPGRRR